MDLEKKLQISIQNQFQTENQLYVKDSVIENQRLTIEQYQEDIEELKEKLALEPTPKKPKSRIDNKDQNEGVESDIKDLLESLSKQEDEQEDK